ncbi:MAG TPA: T9SS type A sorting domain-containing protein [Bacteroides sp.]|nr:T9SS type A sorting domain-containing protein [Bacteroides sp.]
MVCTFRSHVRYCLAIMAICIPASALCQVMIFSSDSMNLADWNYSQRKIIRGPDPCIIVESGYRIFLSRNLGEVEEILAGRSASLAVDPLSRVYIVYENQGIRITSEKEPGIWPAGGLISDTGESASYPVADCDGAGNIHVVYGVVDTTVRGDSYLSTLKYARLSRDSVLHGSVIYRMDPWMQPDTLEQYSIATHLTYADEAVFVAYQLSNDSVYLTYSIDSGVSWRDAVSFPGTHPSLTIGPGYYPPDIIESEIFPVVLFIDPEGSMANSLAYYSVGHFDWMGIRTIHPGPVESACADDLISPFQYNLIFRQKGVLYHAYTEFFGNCQVLDTVSDRALASSIAYKQFNQDKVDIVWIENNGGIYELYYNWFSKIPTGSGDKSHGSALLELESSPNPFNRNITFNIHAPGYEAMLLIHIYDLYGREIKVLRVNDHFNQSEISWNAATEDGDPLNSGIYIARIQRGGQAAIRKIIHTAGWR